MVVVLDERPRPVSRPAPAIEHRPQFPLAPVSDEEKERLVLAATRKRRKLTGLRSERAEPIDGRRAAPVFAGAA